MAIKCTCNELGQGWCNAHGAIHVAEVLTLRQLAPTSTERELERAKAEIEELRKEVERLRGSVASEAKSFALWLENQDRIDGKLSIDSLWQEYTDLFAGESA